MDLKPTRVNYGLRVQTEARDVAVGEDGPWGIVLHANMGNEGRIGVDYYANIQINVH